MSDPRDDLAALVASRRGVTARVNDNDRETADRIIAAGWVFDGSCRDCQANLTTNGGQHMFHCRTPEGKAQWAEEEE